jgi:hypothetical protein
MATGADSPWNHSAKFKPLLSAWDSLFSAPPRFSRNDHLSFDGEGKGDGGRERSKLMSLGPEKSEIGSPASDGVL